MSTIRYKNGSWYVVHVQGKPVMCHNRATAVYLAAQANKIR